MPYKLCWLKHAAPLAEARHFYIGHVGKWEGNNKMAETCHAKSRTYVGKREGHKQRLKHAKSGTYVGKWEGYKKS